ncbi:MAG: class I SAM-dependent methyltransferase [Gammaproteobacteria bacterium]|nr:class I SAM-dependent methyltransferase [Gammaproteobacteria bacterium]
MNGSEVFQRLVQRGAVLGADEVDPGVLGGDAPTGGLVLEHPRIPFWSYPYEWSFGALKAAALAHLDLQIELLDHRIALSDGSAYNVQFLGTRPVFVDVLSLRRYRANEHWAGYRQFCQQFLYPLLLRSKFGVPFQDWFRGRPEGIAVEEVAHLARWHHLLSLGMLLHVIAPGRLQAHAGGWVETRATRAQARGLPMSRYRSLLLQLRDWIAVLRPRAQGPSTWQDYAWGATYDRAEAAAKRALVECFARSVRPALLLDLGCNTGEYAGLALRAGAQKVVGLENDHGALERAFAHAHRATLDLLPLYQDCTDPSPGQGWNGREHRGLVERCADVEAVMALAFVHHVVLGRNIPLADVVRWITSLAPCGLIEFVPKDDRAVQRMLSLRDDAFPGYSFDAFLAALHRHARVVAQRTVSQSGREIVWFVRDAQ